MSGTMRTVLTACELKVARVFIERKSVKLHSLANCRQITPAKRRKIKMSSSEMSFIQRNLKITKAKSSSTAAVTFDFDF